MSAEWDRYLAACHAMQTGVAIQMETDPPGAGISPKHLRTGLNSALVGQGALVRLLIAKGIITEAEYEMALAEAMEAEVERYRTILSAKACGDAGVTLYAVPIELPEANDFIANFHRHNKPAVGHRFSIGASDGARLVGVAIVGRPVARLLQDGHTAEVTRCCVLDDSPKGTCSFLYAAAWRAWRAMGGKRLITYTLQSESGASLRGAGWRVAHQSAENNGAGWTNRPGREWQPVVGQAKFRWEMTA